MQIVPHQSSIELGSPSVFTETDQVRIVTEATAGPGRRLSPAAWMVNDVLRVGQAQANMEVYVGPDPLTVRVPKIDQGFYDPVTDHGSQLGYPEAPDHVSGGWFRWGDGTPDTSFTLPTPNDISWNIEHTYAAPGNYTVRLTLNFVDRIGVAIGHPYHELSVEVV